MSFFLGNYMNVYIVGGAVRDKILKQEIKDIDYVVVGSNEQEMLEMGFTKCGKDFPVFLHPQTKDEWALARTERKTGSGYNGFETKINNVSLEDDLLRRDLTINSIAMDDNGKLIDPFNGLDDIKNKTLRHTSIAFKDDPVRVLRIARFASRYHDIGFVIAKETMELMKEMVNDGMLKELTAERVFKEIKKTLTENNPQIFFEVLRDCGALKDVLPELNNLVNVPQPVEHHPEGCAFNHTMLCLKYARSVTDKSHVLLGTLLHDIGKGVTPKSLLPKHYLHEKNGVPLVREISDRLKFDKKSKEFCLKAVEMHSFAHGLLNSRPKTILKLIENLDGFRKPEMINDFLVVCLSDTRGRKGFEKTEFPQDKYLKSIMRELNKIDIKSHINGDMNGQEIANIKRNARLKKIHETIEIEKKASFDTKFEYSEYSM